MADNLNPFMVDFIENAIETNPDIPAGEPPDNNVETTNRVTLDAIAAKLISDSFVLTALEMHTELLETGRELPRLRDFFSNPSNFERTKQADTICSVLPRTSSCQTLDSLECYRYSDDGDRQESDKVAVLEFELRKAQDTIKSLRASLTTTAGTELLATPDSGGSDPLQDTTVRQRTPLRTYERRSINFLVNEYLLVNDYKLSSVTFAEENESQDFEDWDDVGLNMAQPASLLQLYRDSASQQAAATTATTADVACHVCFETPVDDARLEQLERAERTAAARVAEVEEEIAVVSRENERLRRELQLMEKKTEMIHLMKSSTPAMSPIGTPRKHVDHAATENNIDHELGDHVDGGRDNAAARGTDSMEALVGSAAVSFDDRRHADAAPLAGTADGRTVSAAFQKALLDTTFHLQQDHRITPQISLEGDWSEGRVVLTLAHCLPQIVPNVLLAKRQELIPLILCTAMLHPETRQRDELLNILFNLIKRPDEAQRQMILHGCVAFALHAGAMRVESELLPQCWEQINHKYPERRLLVAEACGLLCPHLPKGLCGSLLLSMLQQMMQEDKLDEVKAAAVRSLAILVAFIDDRQKFTQICQLLFTSLSGSEAVRAAAIGSLLPSSGVWATDLGVLQSRILSPLTDSLQNLVQVALASQAASSSTTLPLDVDQFSRVTDALATLVPVLFCSVLASAPFADDDAKTAAVGEEDRSPGAVYSRPAATSRLTDPEVILGGRDRLARLARAFDEFVSQEWYEQWEALAWVSGEFVPQLLVLLGQLDASQSAVLPGLCHLVSLLTRTFGHTFATSKIKPRFQVVLNVPEDQVAGQVSAGKCVLTKSTVTVFAVGVLAAFTQEEDRKQLEAFLRHLLVTLALCHASLDSIKVTFTQLCLDSKVHDLLLTVLWDGVVHTSASVRCASATMFELLVRAIGENLVATRVVPALVTLASDSDINVKIATIPAFGTIMESIENRGVLDKVQVQLQTIMDDALCREGIPTPNPSPTPGGDEHALSLQLVRMFARVGPNAEPKFRDDFILPRLAAFAASNNAAGVACKTEMSLQLFEAYSALSCCFISEQLVQTALLPGLRCLLADMTHVAAHHVPVITSIMRDFELAAKTRSTGRPEPPAAATTTAIAPEPPTAMVGIATMIGGASAEEVKMKMLSRFKDVKDRASQSNFSKMFSTKK